MIALPLLAALTAGTLGAEAPQAPAPVHWPVLERSLLGALGRPVPPDRLGQAMRETARLLRSEPAVGIAAAIAETFPKVYGLPPSARELIERELATEFVSLPAKDFFDVDAFASIDGELHAGVSGEAAGLWRLKKDRWTEVKTSSIERVWQIVDIDGTAYAATTSGLLRKRGKRWRADPDMQGNTYFVGKALGRLWVSNEAGLYFKDDAGQWSGPAEFPEWTPDSRVERLVEHDGRLFAQTTHGIYSFAGGEWRLTLPRPTQGLVSHNGELVAASREGLHVLRGLVWEDLLPETWDHKIDSLTSLDGALYAGLRGAKGGLTRYVGLLRPDMETRNLGFGMPNISRLARLQDGQVYASNWKGLHRLTALAFLPVDWQDALMAELAALPSLSEPASGTPALEKKDGRSLFSGLMGHIGLRLGGRKRGFAADVWGPITDWLKPLTGKLTPKTLASAREKALTRLRDEPGTAPTEAFARAIIETASLPAAQARKIEDVLARRPILTAPELGVVDRLIPVGDRLYADTAANGLHLLKGRTWVPAGAGLKENAPYHFFEVDGLLEAQSAFDPRSPLRLDERTGQWSWTDRNYPVPPLRAARVDGKLFVLGNSQLFEADASGWKRLFDKRQNEQVTAFGVAGGKLYVQTYFGFYVREQETWRPLDHPWSNVDLAAAIVESPEGAPVVSTGGKLYFLRGGRWESPPWKGRALKALRVGKSLYATDVQGRLFRWEGDSWAPLTRLGESVLSLAEKDGRLWAATFHGPGLILPEPVLPREFETSLEKEIVAARKTPAAPGAGALDGLRRKDGRSLFTDLMARIGLALGGPRAGFAAASTLARLAERLKRNMGLSVPPAAIPAWRENAARALAAASNLTLEAALSAGLAGALRLTPEQEHLVLRHLSGVVLRKDHGDVDDGPYYRLRVIKRRLHIGFRDGILARLPGKRAWTHLFAHTFLHNVVELSPIGDTLHIGSVDGVYSVPDWESKRDGLALPKPALRHHRAPVRRVLRWRGRLYAATGAGVYRFEKQGWRVSLKTFAWDLQVIDGLLYAATEAGLYRFDGKAWTETTAQMEYLPVRCVAKAEGRLFIGTREGLMSSADGAHWTLDVPGVWMETFARLETGLAAGGRQGLFVRRAGHWVKDEAVKLEILDMIRHRGRWYLATNEGLFSFRSPYEDPHGWQEGALSELLPEVEKARAAGASPGKTLILNHKDGRSLLIQLGKISR